MFIILAILSFTFGAQILLRSLSLKFKNYEFLQEYELKFLKYIFYFSIFAVFSSLIYYSYQQYIVWQSAEPSKFLLPPYQSVNYFLYYIGMRFFAPYIVSLSISILFLFVAKIFNKKYDERFFYPEELWFGALALFFAGWPGSLFYFIGLILIYLILHLLLAVSRKSLIKETRISLYYWWIPLAIFVILLSNLLIELEWWKLLKI
ncbi:MAG: hypothetical protein AAB396_01550 [Patescibacteria group bacterium]